MSEHDKKKNDAFDLMQDTQYLLRDWDETQSDSFALADILAEFGGKEPPRTETAAPPPPKLSDETTPPEELPEETKLPEKPKVRQERKSQSDRKLPEKPKKSKVIDLTPTAAGKEEQQQSPPGKAENRPPEPALSRMEDVVASTVDAVKAEKELAQDQMRKRIEKKRRKQMRRRREPQTNVPLPEVAEEPSARDLAAFHKRQYLNCRWHLIPAVIVLVLLWLPWLLAEGGIPVAFFSDGADNAAVCVLVFQAILCVLCAPLFRAVLEEGKKRNGTLYTYTAAANLVTLLDEITLLALPGRTPAAPLGGVAGCALVFSLWGLKNYHRGMWDTFRIAAMGRPTCVVDCCEAGIAKGTGSSEGFVTRAMMESTASQWQRLLLPVLLAASLLFAVLASFGQQRGQDFLWCWSVILCASCSLAAPLAYCVPFGRIARRLNRSGTAVAGQYGAAALSASEKVVVTDTDLFPPKSVSLHGIKLYGEERNRAISYAATLAVQGGGCLGRVFETVCQEEHIAYQPLEHFHIHDDHGLGGMIRGETVLVGPPLFMRHKAVRLPKKLPARTVICLAVDGELVAIFDVKYTVHPPVELAMRALSRNGLSLVLATRDGTITPKLLKNLFGTDGKAKCPETSERLSLSDPQREGGAPNGILYREGILPYVELAALSRRLCQIVRVGNFLSIFGGVFGALLAFYLVFVGSSAVLTPLMLLTYLLLWAAPMLPLLWGVDRI